MIMVKGGPGELREEGVLTFWGLSGCHGWRREDGEWGGVGGGGMGIFKVNKDQQRAF